jgi:tetratricopeptide (TPR) repeat protein
MRYALLTLVVARLALAAAVTPSPQAKAAFDRGEAALAANRLDDAAKAYQDAIAKTPKYAPAINGLGSVLFKQGKKDEAIARFKEAIDADPTFQLAFFNLGYAARKSGDFPTAASAYEKYTQLNPKDPDGFYGLAESYRQSNEPQKAVAAYEKYMAIAPASDQKYIDKAKEYIAQLKAEGQKPTTTTTQPTTTTTTQPTTTATTQPTTTATTQPTTTTTMQPQSTGIPPGGSAAPTVAARKIAEGDQFMSQKKYREASFSYQDATNADPNSVEALFKLGNSYAVLGYYAQAIERWNRVAQISTDPAIKKSAQDNITKAQAKMAAIGGGSPQAQGKTPGSGPVADSTRQQARGFYENGVKQINSRDYAGAVASLSSAIQLEPTLTVAYVARGSAHIGLRRFGEAANDYQYALRLDANMASPLYGLAEAYRAMGRTSDARTYYEKYVASSAPDVRPDLQSEARSKAEKLR